MNPSNSQNAQEHVLCDGAWAVPPSPHMISHGNYYHTCSACGGKVKGNGFVTFKTDAQFKITCRKCGAKDVPDWNGKGLCITCTRNETLGEDELRKELRNLRRPERVSSKYPIEAYEDDLVALIAQCEQAAELRGKTVVLKKLAGKVTPRYEDTHPEYTKGFEEMKSKVKFELRRLQATKPEKGAEE